MSKTMYRESSSFSDEKNQQLKHQYLTLKDSDVLEKTHFFDGRFENIYVDRESIQGLPSLLDEALEKAANILKKPSADLRLGFWFNEMQRGHTTTAHTHDEDDELLSGVYYIDVPENSGDLILGDAEHNDSISITPKAGEFIFFAPDCLHSVTENQSGEIRLSIGINFGSVET